MSVSRRGFIVGCAAISLGAQEAKFSTDVKVVTLLATVRDKEGRIVNDLDRTDFVLKEDGVSQTIRYFSRESDLPLTVGLLVDTSRSQIGVLEPERKASYTFLDRVLRDNDQAFIASFDVQVDLLQDFTSSRQDLQAALADLRIPGQFATLIFSAVRTCAENMMRKRNGRKAFILLSDGVAFRDDTSIETAIEYAQRADTIIYSILFADHVRVYRPGQAIVTAIMAARGRRALQRLSEETGGAYFQVNKEHSLEEIYSRIEEALRSQYSIGYTPLRRDADRSYRKVKLTTLRQGLILQARDGYYPR